MCTTFCAASHARVGKRSRARALCDALTPCLQLLRRCLGCTCAPSLVSAHHNLRQSTIHLLHLSPSQAEECRIIITVVEGSGPSTQQGHKFKITGVRRGKAGEAEGTGGEAASSGCVHAHTSSMHMRMHLHVFQQLCMASSLSCVLA
jgi:hypothetical protein